MDTQSKFKMTNKGGEWDLNESQNLHFHLGKYLTARLLAH